MKKKIAVFATGWSGDNLYNYIKGIYDELQGVSADIYLLMSYPTLGDDSDFLRGELNIYNLPDLKEFDVAVVDAIGLNFPGLLEGIYEKCDALRIPVINLVHDDKKHYFVGTDNEIGQRELSEHLIGVHNVKDIFFLAGRRDNDDSNSRLKALSDVMASHGLELSEDRIFYTEWDPNRAKDFIREWVRKKKKLPDAFVCANDELAMVLCAELRQFQIDVPKDVIVTGFDNEYMSSIFDPAISSVNQRFDKIGNTIAEMSIRLSDGEQCDRTKIISCEFVPSESCGCTAAQDFSGIRRELGRNKFLEIMQLSFFNRSFAEMERRVLQGNVYADIKENLKIILETIDNYEGDSFHIVLDPLYEETIMDSNKSLRRSGYPDKMDVIFSMDCKTYKNVKNFKTKDIVPYIKDKQRNHLFLCTPLHNNGESMGYAVFEDNLELLRDADTIRVYLDRLNNILSKYKQTLSLNYLNQRLLQLSETDALTHVKNRMAYHSRKEKINAELNQNRNMEFAIVVCDLNGLKQVNDVYGHEVGDEYIINSCKMICETFKHSAIYRIGGDEFAILLFGEDYESRHKLLEELDVEMEKMRGQELPPGEKISIACGLADYDPNRDGNVNAVLRRADLKMYENKQYMKKKI